VLAITRVKVQASLPVEGRPNHLEVDLASLPVEGHPNRLEVDLASRLVEDLGNLLAVVQGSQVMDRESLDREGQEITAPSLADLGLEAKKRPWLSRKLLHRAGYLS
jgi:hypothetical protein